MQSVRDIIDGMKNSEHPIDYWNNHLNTFKELQSTCSIIQNNNESVWNHIMRVLDILTVKNDITLLSALFHDIGKIKSTNKHNDMVSKFAGHDIESAKIAKTKLKDWGASSQTIDSVCRIVSTHMFDIKIAIKEKTLRKFTATVGVKNIDNWFVLREADSRAYDIYRKCNANMLNNFKKSVKLYISEQPNIGQQEFKNDRTNNTLNIRGND